MDLKRFSIVSICLMAGVIALKAWAQSPRTGEWPQWRGPDRTGLSREMGLLKRWPAEGPRLVWKTEGLGDGYSTPSLAGGRIFGMGYRGDDEVVWALDSRTGKEMWTARIARAQRPVSRGDGPRSTPTVDGDRLYALGVHGQLACLAVADGKLLWSKHLVEDFGARVPGWGYSESPLIDGESVIVTPGGNAATIVCLNKQTGETRWQSAISDGNRAHYSSVIAAEVGGRRQYIQFLQGGVVGVSATDGKLLWRNDHAANNTANCSTPIFHDSHVFVAAGYGKGGRLIKLSPESDRITATEVYSTPQMRNHHGGMVLVGDYLYGFDESNLTCLNFKTGQVAWFDRSVGKGSVVYADGHLVARSERGPVALVEANPASYIEKGRFEQPERSNLSSWPHPVVAGGRLYLRDQGILLCYDVRETSQ